MAERPLTRKKGLGSYYTHLRVVEFLVDWGMSVAPGVVMDPSCGDGRFLGVAIRRGASEVIGCDVDQEALKVALSAVDDAPVSKMLLHSDFFFHDPTQLGPVDLIVGNPPFIRYQQFSGESRARALASALRVGARLTKLSASWAPFLLHALQFLRPQGALAMVVPAELAQTAYGIATLRALCANFARIRLITFRNNWFEDAQQETFLLMAEGRGGACSSAELTPLERIDDLEQFLAGPTSRESFRLEANTRSALGLAYVDARTRALWSELLAQPERVALGTLGDVVNGYVSGANAFFHCTKIEALERALPADWLFKVARSIRSLRGLAFEASDIEDLERSGIGHHLILPRFDDLFSFDQTALDDFVATGERLGISLRYKCRARSPWWQVPGLIMADVLLPYMIGREPRSAVNRCHAIYPNSLHGIRLSDTLLAERLAFALLSSLSLLGMELEGRSYGGGVLKLEPTEMQRVPVILPTCSQNELCDHFEAADREIRAGNFSVATRLADQVIFKEQLGLSATEIRRLEQARSNLVERRMERGKRNKT